MMKSIIQHRFNKNAITYDTSAFLQKEVGRKLAQNLPNQATRILEIGCGTGLFSEYLINLFPSAELVLTDLAPNMILQAQKRFRDHSNIQFLCLDGEELFLEKKFDLIVSNMTLHWFANPKDSFKKILDILKPRGHFIFSLVGANSLSEWQAIYDKYQYPISTPFFPSCEKLEESFSFYSLIAEQNIQKYKDAYHFLTSLKKIGATSPRAESVPLTSGKLRKILREFSEELRMTYEIIYGHYIKQ